MNQTHCFESMVRGGRAIPPRTSSCNPHITSLNFPSLLMEETIRFIKQSYNLEDLRKLDHDRLKNIVMLVLTAAFFAAVRLGEDLKLAVLSHHVTRLAKRFFGVQDFHYYALADGIATLLARCSKGPLDPRPARTPPDPQQFLFALGP